MTNPQRSIRHANRAHFAPGCIFWSTLSFVAVFGRGVSWDETYEHALAISGFAPYPGGHPFYLYIRNIFSLQSYLSAGMLWLTKGPLLICYLRDVVTLVLMTVPLYFLAVTLTQRAIWGHVAVALGLSNAYVFFASHYGIGVWPGYFSVGAIGAGYALLVFAAFMANWTRTAWFLLSLLTAVHLGHWPPLMMFAGFQLLHWDAARRKEHWQAAIIWGGSGLLIVVFFFVVQRFFHVPYPVDGPYFAVGDAQEIWINYSMREDVHRFINYLRPFSYSILLIAIVLFAGTFAVLCEPPQMRMKSAYARILLYAGCVATLAIGIRIIHAILGRDVPFLLIGWMPYRIPNQLAPVLLCMMITIVARGAGKERRYTPEVWAIALLLAALPAAARGLLISEDLYQRYIEGGEYLCFFLLGGAVAVLAERLLFISKSWFLFVFPSVLVGAGMLLWFSQFIFACSIAGLGFHALRRLSPNDRIATKNWVRVCALCVVIVLGLHLHREWRGREHLPRTAFQQGVVEYLASVDDSTAMIIPPIWEVEWSARLGVPVFADYGTPRYVTYVPALGPVLQKMHRDVFGFNLDGAPNDGAQPLTERSATDWQQLGRAYGFRYVVQPAELPLNLDAVYSRDEFVLYAVSVPEVSNVTTSP